MRFFCVFCTFLTFMRWKICCVELQSSGSFSSGDQHSVIGSMTESIANMLTVSSVPAYAVHASDQSEDSQTSVPIASFVLERDRTENSAQLEMPMSLLPNSIAPDVTKFITHSAHSKAYDPSKALLTSSPQHAVPSELTQTSLAEDNLTPKDNSASARMLNLSPDIISTSPIDSVNEIDKQLEIRATPTTRIASSNYSKSLESNIASEHDVAKIQNSTRPILQANGTKSVKVEKRTNTHTMVIVPAVIGVISVLSVGFMAALYQWHQRGRRRKVYLSHPGALPKDFAEDTGVRSPVLLPEEIEMQVGRSQSLRVRRAVILATDPPVVEADSTAVNVESVTAVAVSDDPVTNSTPPPPPYREPPPYLPDMIIENIHAL